MSLDKSLVSKQRLVRHRNVLSRSERISVLEEDERWEEGNSLFGLPKVKNMKAKRRSKSAEKKEKEEAAAAAAEAAEAAEGAEAAETGEKEEP
ncbi:MAG: small basic protein [Planctomycetes bacterium]|nr:small basic protein [Planctomycetota bacterium]